MKKLDMVIDLQFGSTGKGLIAGYLAEKHGYDTVINANMPNAGHTYINNDGREWIHKVLPNGIVSPNLKRVMIGPGSIFSEQRMLDEINASKDLLQGKGVKILVHANAVILTKEHASLEREKLQSISSTMQGSAAAMIQKIWRQAGNNPCIGAADTSDELNRHIEIISPSDWNSIVNNDVDYALLEGAQGYSLGLNAGFYPYCTSRDCVPTRFLADCQVPMIRDIRIIGTARVHPIRVGNLPGSSSGDYYPDQGELTWDEVGVTPETTTVTGRKRRVFSFSRIQIEQAIMACQPNEVFLNFCNYDPDEAKWAMDSISNSLFDLGPLGAHVSYTGWGPTRKDVLYGGEAKWPQ